MATFDWYAQVIPDEFYNITLEHTCAGAPDVQLCTFGFRDGVGDIELTDLEDIVDAWATRIVPSMHPNQTFVRAYASDAGGVVMEVPSGAVGADVNEPSPITTAIIVEKGTGLSGRRNRGRMYIPVVNDSLVDIAGNLVAGAPLTAFRTAVTNFLADVEAAGGGGIGGMYLLHSKGWDGADRQASEPPDPGNAPAPTKVTTLTVKSKIGTQRRRIR